eukprot:GEMP01052256.1.p1 GENE.GEMP01052256.1~~GEMP01052256.1.p1  ORF type:complete len:286 (+),score=43.12 GEMP01052256.1:66-923(+)
MPKKSSIMQTKPRPKPVTLSLNFCRTQRRMNQLLLSEFFFFARTSQKFLESLAVLAKTKVFEAGDVVFKEEDASTDMYIIRAGRGLVELSTKKRGIQTVLRSGDCFGELGLLGLAKSRICTATAKTVCHTSVVKRDYDFLDLLRRFPADVTTIESTVSNYIKHRPTLNFQFTEDMARSSIVNSKHWGLLSNDQSTEYCERIAAERQVDAEHRRFQIERFLHNAIGADMRHMIAKRKVTTGKFSLPSVRHSKGRPEFHSIMTNDTSIETHPSIYSETSLSLSGSLI